MDVPYLSASEIEKEAALLLAEFNIGRGRSLVAPVPVEEVLEAHLKLTLDFDDLHTRLGIPMTGAEPEVFGALWVNSREVFVDQSLDPAENPNIEGRYRFTVSHEIGHWRLHRDHLASADHLDLFKESAKPGVVICRSSQAKKRAGPLWDGQAWQRYRLISRLGSIRRPSHTSSTRRSRRWRPSSMFRSRPCSCASANLVYSVSNPRIKHPL